MSELAARYGASVAEETSDWRHHGDMPEKTMADAEKWTVGMQVPAYAIDDQTAIKVTDGTVEVASEGHWKLFPQPEARDIGLMRHARLGWVSVRD